MPRIDPARASALELLRRVLIEDAYANLAMPLILAEDGLSGRDAAFATELGYGTLRMQGRHDALIAACVRRPLEDLDPAVLAVLRLGVHQLTAMRVPPHAAVSTSVDLAREESGQGAAKLVNAVLRKISDRPLVEWLAQVTDGLPDLERLAIVHSHPTWAIEALADSLRADGQPDALEELLAANNKPAPVTLVARRMSRESLLREADGSTPTPLSRVGVRLSSGDPGELASVRSGAAAVQDEGSQLVALSLADAPLDDPDSQWLDLCAGPGGKAALLLELAGARGGSLTAVELHEHRAGFVRRALSSSSFPSRVIVGDATRVDLGGPFDRVIVDAPCTGLGAIRRRPESRWRERDLGQLVALQKSLLARAAEVTRPGGLIMYSTCSPHPAETTQVVDWATSNLPLTPGTALRTWPHLNDTDAMFGQVLTRR